MSCKQMGQRNDRLVPAYSDCPEKWLLNSVIVIFPDDNNLFSVLALLIER